MKYVLSYPHTSVCGYSQIRKRICGEAYPLEVSTTERQENMDRLLTVRFLVRGGG